MPDISFKCGTCGKHLVIDNAGAGQTINCPDCNASMTIPSNPNALPPMGRNCSSCGAAINQDAVICINCGVHLKTGIKLQSSESQPAILQPVAVVADRAAHEASLGRGVLSKVLIVAGIIGLVIGAFLIGGRWFGGNRTTVNQPPVTAQSPQSK
jgi:hypothetical protein